MTQTLPHLAGRWRSTAAGNLRAARCWTWPGGVTTRGRCRPRMVRTTKRF